MALPPVAKVSGLALVFSGVGLYSAVAYAVRRRTQEIAVRMALGVQATQVRWLFLKNGAGVIMVRSDPRRACRTHARSTAAEHVRAHRGARPVTLIVTAAVLAIVALVASVVPAQRATRLEPTTALRIE